MDSSQGPPPNDQRHEGDVAPLVSKDSPTVEEVRSGEPARDPNTTRDSPDQRMSMARERSDFTARYRQWSRSSLGLPVEPSLVVPKKLLTAEEVRSGEPARDPNATGDSSNQSIGMGRQGSEPSPGLRAMEASIHMAARPSGLNDQSASDRPSVGRGTYRSVARFFITGLIVAFIGAAASSAWQSHGDKAKEMVRTWAPSLGSLSSAWQSRGDEAKRLVSTWASSLDLDWLLSVSTTKLGSTPGGQLSRQDAALPQSAPITQKPVPAAAAISPELVQQLEATARDVAVVRRRVEQLATTQEQMTHNIASLKAIQQDIRQKMPSPPLPPAASLPPRKIAPRVAPPQLPARASILADWSIRDTRDGYVTVQGHGDAYQVVPGTPLPGLGPVEQIKGQDGHWVVVTPKGIIVPRRGPRSDDEDDVFDGDSDNRDDDAD